MADHHVNGKQQDIHDNVIFIRGSIARLEDTMERLADSVNRLAQAEESRSLSNDKILNYMQNSMNIKVVLLLCGIIVLAFVGGGVLKEILDAHFLTKLFL